MAQVVAPLVAVGDLLQDLPHLRRPDAAVLPQLVQVVRQRRVPFRRLHQRRQRLELEVRVGDAWGGGGTESLGGQRGRSVYLAIVQFLPSPPPKKELVRPFISEITFFEI